VPPKPQECRARVAAVRAPAPDVVEVDLAMLEPATFRFDAGQWVSVPFGPKTVRAYSIASTPQSRSLITLCADVAPAGIGSKWIAALAPGDEVRFKGPTGGFVYSRADPRPPLFVAEEIGVVPIRAILVDLFETGFGRPTALVQWARQPAGLVYGEEFRRLERRYPAFAYHPRVARAGENGDIADVVARVAPPAPFVTYVAGGGAAIDRVRQTVMARGLDRRSVKWEKFW
jgi:ferredoxin-NADP reductase